ncbi:site-specific DNA-methyltransferase [Dietzia sp. Alg238-R159]|uniref:site-specific DNA-methyltransferase n=1 Tax=Dietzia sp. Alg238-R159 TaxID=2305986 RepID=UPI0013D7E2E6|nr:site-specific DNA-methyltransferase [Dietzia sp. Alg238-R159]
MSTSKAQRLELTWFNKDKALIPTENGRYGYSWVSPQDPRYCQIRPLVLGETVNGVQASKQEGVVYSARADLEPTTGNLLINGESGDVLEALTRVPELADQYLGKVKLCYIDPPFNTEKTFEHYEDNLEHSIWLTMMRDRLLHIKKLLSPDGSIWVHLDDSENHRMRVLLDEVFGAENFVAEVVWQKADSPRSDGGKISIDQDVILVFGRSAKFYAKRLPRLASRDALYKSPDGDPERWVSGDPAAPGADRGSRQHPGVYGIQNPVTGEMVYPARGRVWSNTQADVLKMLGKTTDYRPCEADLNQRAQATGIALERLRADVPDLVLAGPRLTGDDIYRGRVLPRLYFTKGGSGGLKMKKYLSEIAPDRATQSWWTKEDVGHNRGAKKELRALFPEQNPFATPKPERLLERVIHVATNPSDIVLDVFAGSGTTAAVAHKMGRRWVTCELLESNFSQFTLPRLTKVIHGEDPGGITTTAGERVDATEDGLPEGMEASEAFSLTQALGKIAEVVAAPVDLAKVVGAAVRADSKTGEPVLGADEAKELRRLMRKLATSEADNTDFLPLVRKAAGDQLKTRKSPDIVNWRGGGSFRVAHLAPECFDYEPELGLVTLTSAALEGDNLERSVAAHLSFHLTPEHPVFTGIRGRTRLVVMRSAATPELVAEIATHIGDDEKMVIAATAVDPDTAQALRNARKGSRVLHIPADLFRVDEIED